jgi:hypothetical protein
MVYNHTGQGTLPAFAFLHLSIFFSVSHKFLINDQFIMRFSTFVAFMLPLSALAAPYPGDCSAGLDIIRQQFVDSLITTGTALNATLDQAHAIQSPPQQELINGATKAKENIERAGEAVLRIGAALEVGKVPNDSEYVNNPRLYNGQNH